MSTLSYITRSFRTGDKKIFERLDIYTPIHFFQQDNMCTEKMFAAGKKQEEMMAGDICYTFTGYIP